MNGIAKVAGCRPPWNAKSSSDIEVCSTSSDIFKYINHEHRIRNYEQELIIQKTGCLRPCKFREYVSAGMTSKHQNLTNVDLKGKYCLNFVLASTVLDIKTESFVYPGISFVSEIGGSLGLFVGFSFLTIYDWFDQIFAKILSKTNYFY